MAVKVNTIDTSPLREYARQIAAGVGPIDDMFKKWGVRYLSFTRRRFIRLSRGGEWARLAESTRKSKPKRPTGSPVLVVGGQLRDSLGVGHPGNHFRRIPKAIEVGFAERTFAGSKTTIRDIAVFHDEGKGNLPKREILVEPDAATIKGWEKDVKTAAEALGRLAERKLR